MTQVTIFDRDGEDARRMAMLVLVGALGLLLPASGALGEAVPLTPYMVRVEATSALGSGSLEFAFPPGTAIVGDYLWDLGGEEIITGPGGVPLGRVYLFVWFSDVGDVYLYFYVFADAAETAFTITSARIGFAPLTNPWANAWGRLALSDTDGNGAVLTGLLPGGCAYEARYNDPYVAWASFFSSGLVAPAGWMVPAEEWRDPWPVVGTVSSVSAGFRFKITPNDYVDGEGWFAVGVPPTITQHPASQSVPEGGTAVFTVQGSGIGPSSGYVWQKGGVNLSDGGKISGATSATLRITGVSSADAGAYRCVVSNPFGSATSNSAALMVTLNVFIVESRAGGQNLAKYSETGVWANSSIKSSAPGTTPGIGARYGSTYRTMAGEKHALFDADLPATGTYEVFVTWAAAQNRRNPILHRITHAAGTTDVNVDQTATDNTWVSLGTYTFSAGTNVGRVDVNNLNTDLSGSMYADAVKWEYRGGPQPPTITQQPVAQNVCSGGVAAFTVAATGDGTISYQWQKDGTNLSEGGHYLGTTTPTLMISAADGDDCASYRCVVTNASGSTNSNAAALTFKTATAITQQPVNQSVCAGAASVFAVAAAGDGMIAYRWQKNQIDLSDGGHYSGASTDTLTVSTVNNGDVAVFRCVVTGDCGSVTSDEATLSLANVASDLDCDNDVDLRDAMRFQACFNGPNRPPAGPDCGGFDFDKDDDVDLADFAVFQACFNGPNRPPRC